MSKAWLERVADFKQPWHWEKSRLQCAGPWSPWENQNCTLWQISCFAPQQLSWGSIFERFRLLFVIIQPPTHFETYFCWKHIDYQFKTSVEIYFLRGPLQEKRTLCYCVAQILFCTIRTHPKIVIPMSTRSGAGAGPKKQQKQKQCFFHL